VGQAWGEVVFPEDKADKTDKTNGDNGEEQAAEALFHIQELRRRRGSDTHTLLGVKGDASKKEIQEAYHYLAAVLHPDRHHPDLAGDLAEEMIELFKEVAAAYEELTAGGKLAKVTQHEAPFPQSGERMSAPSGSLDPGDETRRLFYKAKGYISGGNYWQAVDSLRQVVRRKPKDADCRNLLGFCLMQTGRRLHEAEEHLEEAIRLDPGNPDYLINLGLVYKAGRSYKKARAIFQQALLYNKNHAMARQELKNLPRDIEWGRETGGFWKKIFGK
jgi:tetratricopeptide (TPR) repeat protein